jgi:hypothetical protein
MRRSVHREEQSIWGSNLLRMFKVDRPGRRGQTHNLPCAPKNQAVPRNSVLLFLELWLDSLDAPLLPEPFTSGGKVVRVLGLSNVQTGVGQM